MVAANRTKLTRANLVFLSVFAMLMVLAGFLLPELSEFGTIVFEVLIVGPPVYFTVMFLRSLYTKPSLSEVTFDPDLQQIAFCNRRFSVASGNVSFRKYVPRGMAHSGGTVVSIVDGVNSIDIAFPHIHLDPERYERGRSSKGEIWTEDRRLLEDIIQTARTGS